MHVYMRSTVYLQYFPGACGRSGTRKSRATNKHLIFYEKAELYNKFEEKKLIKFQYS